MSRKEASIRVKGYIDLHNHILPDLDDGPDTMEEAVALAREMVAAGYGTVVATPHSSGGMPSPTLIKNRVRELQDELNREGIPLTILPGAEQHIEPETCRLLEAGAIQTLNDTRYILLELPMFQPLPVYTLKVISDLRMHQYRPVIPHPERVTALQLKRNLLFDLYRAGAYYQVTWGALNGLVGPAARSVVRFMLVSDLAHLMATDAHKPSTRLLAVQKAEKNLQKIKGESFAETLLVTRPLKLIENHDLDLPEPAENTKGITSRIPLLSRLTRNRLRRAQTGDGSPFDS